ncbi:hypothetical protein ACFIQF_15975 [Comamonas sp. J-3]|uniref:hypothetical protein n=1 Tax=Comamonas trifloxystrobinivorans TaxID=3350256 RepID=UPI00372C8E9D
MAGFIKNAGLAAGRKKRLRALFFVAETTGWQQNSAACRLAMTAERCLQSCRWRIASKLRILNAGLLGREAKRKSLLTKLLMGRSPLVQTYNRSEVNNYAALNSFS